MTQLTSFRRGVLSAIAALLLAGSASVSAAALKIATLAPEGSSWMREMRAAGDAIKAQTEGRVELKYFPGGVMGSGETVLRKIKLGQLNGGAFASSELTSVVPNVQVYGLPFLFETLDQVREARKTLDPLIKAEFDKKGMTLAGITGGGFIYLMSSKPIATQADMRKTKVWVPEGDTIARVAFDEAGMSPVQLSLADVYTSLQTGLVETVGNTTTGAVAFQWATKLKMMIDLPVSFTFGFLTIDNKALAKLTPEDKAVVLAEIDKAFAKLESTNAVDDAKTRETLKSEGIEIVTPSAAEIEAWRDVGRRTQARLLKDGVVSQDLMNALPARGKPAAAGG